MQYKYKSLAFITCAILAGVFAGFFFNFLYQIIMYMSSSQHKISCHDLTQANAKREYCVYLRHTPGLLSQNNQLLIGPSPSRGIIYEIPYDLAEVQVAWGDNDMLSVSMPGTKLSIDRSEYIDSR